MAQGRVSLALSPNGMNREELFPLAVGQAFQANTSPVPSTPEQTHAYRH